MTGSGSAYGMLSASSASGAIRLSAPIEPAMATSGTTARAGPGKGVSFTGRQRLALARTSLRSLCVSSVRGFPLVPHSRPKIATDAKVKAAIPNHCGASAAARIGKRRRGIFDAPVIELGAIGGIIA